MASAFYLMHKKNISFYMVPLTFVQVASKFIVALFYLYNFFFPNEKGEAQRYQMAGLRSLGK